MTGVWKYHHHIHVHGSKKMHHSMCSSQWYTISGNQKYGMVLLITIIIIMKCYMRSYPCGLFVFIASKLINLSS